MPNENVDVGLMRCSKDRATLVQSGQEPHRFVCEACGQNYMVVMQLVPVEPLRRLQLPSENPIAERRS